MGADETTDDAAHVDADVGGQRGFVVYRARQYHALGLSLGRGPHLKRYLGIVPTEEVLGFDDEYLPPLVPRSTLDKLRFPHCIIQPYQHLDDHVVVNFHVAGVVYLARLISIDLSIPILRLKSCR